MKDFKGPTNTMLFSDYHLAKLNPNCHMNYSIIFTEISFSPETSNLTEFWLFQVLISHIYSDCDKVELLQDGS